MNDERVICEVDNMFPKYMFKLTVKITCESCDHRSVKEQFFCLEKRAKEAQKEAVDFAEMFLDQSSWNLETSITRITMR
jgi:predicted methyltransferase